MKKGTITLSELNNLVEETLRLSLQSSFWLVAELSEVHIARGGHCYLEFIEKEENSDKLIAKARGTIWNSTFSFLKPYFEEQTGQAFVAGIKVLVQVNINFHELYGYSLNVVNIDPSYTIGDATRRRRDILSLLEKEGVINMNKELPLSRILKNIAVISSPLAAGYGDFCHQLEIEGKDYNFNIQLFPAIMQGEKVETSIIHSLDKILNSNKDWDAVIIIRGGGAISDLQGFDTYLLAASIAQFPIPIITGIGHERDNTVIDFIANTRLKTPTAVADFLITNRKNEDELLKNICSDLKEATLAKLEQENRKFESLLRRTLHLNDKYNSIQKNRIIQKQQRLELAINHLIYKNKTILNNKSIFLIQNCKNIFSQQEHQLKLFEKIITANDPKDLFKKGYSITLVNGHLIKNIAELKKDDQLTTITADGKIESKISNIIKGL